MHDYAWLKSNDQRDKVLRSCNVLRHTYGQPNRHLLQSHSTLHLIQATAIAGSPLSENTAPLLLDHILTNSLMNSCYHPTIFFCF